MPDVIVTPDSRNEKPRDQQQRWLKWRNISEYDCPPYGFFSIVSTEIVNGEIIFLGEWHHANGSLTDYGVPWTAGFNSSEAVLSGGTGRFTMDLPTWCLIYATLGSESDDVEDLVSSQSGLMGFVTYEDGEQHGWALTLLTDHVDDGVPRPSSPYWTGYRILALHSISEFDLWWTKQPAPDPGRSFIIGFIGGLVTEHRGGAEEVGRTEV